MIMSGGRPNSFAINHCESSGHTLAVGMSFGFPIAAPESTHRAIIEIWVALNDMSFLNFCTPTVESKCHGGICLATTRSFTERAHGRVSSYVTRDMGAMPPLR